MSSVAPSGTSATASAAFGADAPVIIGPIPNGGAALALGLHPERDETWCVALVRTRATWTPAEQRTLAELRPCLELALGHALLRARVAEAREREAAAAA